MNHFVLYFVSGLAPANLSTLKKSVVGGVVADVTSDDQLAVVKLDVGPSGQPGVLFCVPPAGKVPDDFGFFSDRQTWTESTDGVWVGWNDAAVIRPEHLVRRRCPVSDFEIVEMADGSQWEVPLLRDPTGGGDGIVFESEHHTTSLKTTMWRRPDGMWQRSVTEEYVQLWEESRKWFDWLLKGAESGGRLSFAYGDVFEYAVRVLGLHYRYGLHLNDALRGRFLQSEEVSQVLAVSCGWSIVNRFLDQKKNTPAIRA